MIDEHDPTIERIADALRPLPDVDPSAKARVLVAIAAERAKVRARVTARVTRRSRLGSRAARWAGAIAGLAAAAALMTFALRQNQRSEVRSTSPEAAAASVPTPAAGQPATVSTGALVASADAGGGAPQPVQLVLHAQGAHRVSVVGDFTGWDERRAAMTRDPASGLWTVTLALRPGRHVYAFLVDDSIWVRDPRAPVAADADFGRPGSVLLVGRP